MLRRLAGSMAIKLEENTTTGLCGEVIVMGDNASRATVMVDLNSEQTSAS